MKKIKDWFRLIEKPYTTSPDLSSVEEKGNDCS